MVRLKRVVLDVLKPHQPNALTFCRELAQLGDDYRVFLNVEEMDESTQTVQLEIRGDDIDLAPLVEAIEDMGASVHSVDQVAVVNEPGED